MIVRPSACDRTPHAMPSTVVERRQLSSQILAGPAALRKGGPFDPRPVSVTGNVASGRVTRRDMGEPTSATGNLAKKC